MNHTIKNGRIIVIIMTLIIAVTMVFSSPVLAASEDEAGSNSAISGEQTSSDQDQGQDQGQQQEPAAPVVQEKPKVLTPAEKQAEAIRKYGYYNGKNASKIPVITYHKIVTDAEKKSKKFKRNSLAVSRSTFAKQMKWLHDKGYRTISCEEFYLWHEGKIKLPKRSVLITFDDGYIGVVQNALPILKQYGMKGTQFLIGVSTYGNKATSVSYGMMKSVQATYPNFEFQSHTFNLHKHIKEKGSYNKALTDSRTQKQIFGFDYLAYPYGKYTKGMIKAYQQTGIKMAFTYGKNGYATRKQNLYKIRRIKISGTGSFSSFKRWVR